MTSASNWTMISDISASSTLEFLGSLREGSKSVQTYNHYLKSAKQFTRWLVRDRRTVSDPLAHLFKLNVSIDRWHDRRTLSAEEFQRLVEAARVGDPIETISGPDRAMRYIVAAWTGFRKGEIGSLTRSSFMDLMMLFRFMSAPVTPEQPRDGARQLWSLPEWGPAIV